MKDYYQKSQPEQSHQSSKNKYSKSFGSQKAASILVQFKRKTAQVLNDDLKMRKLHQSFKPIQPHYKGEIKEFLKQFKNKSKEQFIQLSNFLIDKYVDLVNLKIYLWYFREGKDMGSWEEALPFCGILDSFSQSILTEQSQKAWSKSIQSQETSTKKTESIHHGQHDPMQDFYMSPLPKRLQRFDSLPDSYEIKNLELTKDTKELIKPLQKFFESLSVGSLQQAYKQKLPDVLSSKLKSKIEKFYQQSQVIKRIIQYLNGTALASDKVKPQISLKNLQKCMEKINKLKEKSHLSKKSFKNNETLNTKQQLSQSMQSVQSLELALTQAQQLFNKKSIEYSLEKMNFTKEMNEKIKILQDENIQLTDEILQLKSRIQQKQKQNLSIKDDHMHRCEIKFIQHENTIKQLMQQIREKEKKLQQLEQISRFTLQKQQTEGQKIHELQKYIQTLKLQNQQIKSEIKAFEMKIKGLENQNNNLMEIKQNYETQKQSDLQTSGLKLQIFEEKKTQLERINKQLAVQIKNLSQSLKESKSLFENQLKIEQNLIDMTFYYTKMNGLFQSSNILPPLSEKIFNQKIIKNSSLLQESSSQKRKEILRENNLNFMVQKQFLVEQVENYAGKIGSKTKIDAFKLIYKFDNQLRTNFHEYIDQKPNFLLLVKLKTGAIIGGYSHQPLHKGVRTQLGFLFSVSLMQTYFLKDKYCLIYDEYYLIFGNSQIRIRLGENVFYSNFGILKGHFDVKDKNVTDFLMAQYEREQPIEFFQIYEVSYGDE